MSDPLDPRTSNDGRRWWHRWIVTEVEWMGIPATERRLWDGFMFRRSAQSRANDLRKYGFKAEVRRG